MQDKTQNATNKGFESSLNSKNSNKNSSNLRNLNENSKNSNKNSSENSSENLKNSSENSSENSKNSNSQNSNKNLKNSNESPAKQGIKLPFSKTFTLKRPFIKSVRGAKAQDTSIAAQSEKEQRVLKISMLSALVLAVFGIGFGVSVKSLAVVFDGFVSLVSVGLGALSVITSRYIYKEDDDIFQYGYVRFEPMVNLFKSLVLVLVCVYAFINAVSSILRGGYSVDFGGVAVYSLCAFVFCLTLFAYTKLAQRALESDLIKVDNVEWKIDCVLYAGAIVAFSLVYLSISNSALSVDFGEAAATYENLNSTLNLNENSANFASNSNQIQTLWLNFLSFINKFSHFIDPFLLALLSLVLCVSPLKIAVANFKDLVMLAPPELDERITQIMEQTSVKYGFKDYDTHTAKSGRFFMVEINILVQQDFESSVANLDAIREEIERALAIPSYKIWLSISFTTNPKWL